jgi:hypothetical protein
MGNDEKGSLRPTTSQTPHPCPLTRSTDTLNCLYKRVW